MFHLFISYEFLFLLFQPFPTGKLNQKICSPDAYSFKNRKK